MGDDDDYEDENSFCVSAIISGWPSLTHDTYWFLNGADSPPPRKINNCRPDLRRKKIQRCFVGRPNVRTQLRDKFWFIRFRREKCCRISLSTRTDFFVHSDWFLRQLRLLLNASFGTACKNVDRESADYIKCVNDDGLNNDKDNFICYLPSHHLRRPSWHLSLHCWLRTWQLCASLHRFWSVWRECLEIIIFHICHGSRGYICVNFFWPV